MAPPRQAPVCSGVRSSRADIQCVDDCVHGRTCCPTRRALTGRPCTGCSRCCLSTIASRRSVACVVEVNCGFVGPCDEVASHRIAAAAQVDAIENFAGGDLVRLDGVVVAGQVISGIGADRYSELRAVDGVAGDGNSAGSEDQDAGGGIARISDDTRGPDIVANTIAGNGSDGSEPNLNGVFGGASRGARTDHGVARDGDICALLVPGDGDFEVPASPL